MALNEKMLEHSLEKVGEPIELLSPDGVRYPIKGQVVRVYVTAGEDSRGIAQGSVQLMKIASAVVTLRISTVVGIEPSGVLKGWACTVRRRPQQDSPTQLMYAEMAPDGDTSMGIAILNLTAIRKVTP